MKATRINLAILTIPLIFVIGPRASLAAPVEAPLPEVLSYETRATFDGWLFSSKILASEVARTGPNVGEGQIRPDGIGVLAAGRKALDAFRNLELLKDEEWQLYSVRRKHYPKTGWVYEAAFTKISEDSPDSLVNQLPITILLDGTVIPVQPRANPRPSTPPSAQQGEDGDAGDAAE